MTSPAKTRSRSLAGIDPRMGVVVNDNTPPAYPGHELSDLDGVPRQPAAEAVAHYARLSQIASYPMHPHVAPEPAFVPAMDALPEKTRQRRTTAKKGTAVAGFCSLLFHAAVFAVLTTAAVSLPEDPVEEAGDTLSVVMLGDSDANQMASGEKSEEPPKPDEVVAESVQPDVVHPTTSEMADATPVDPVHAVQPAQPMPEVVQPDEVQPTQAVTQVSPETVVSPAPEVLTAQVPITPDDTAISQPMATEVPPEEMKPADASPSETPPTTVQPQTVQPTEAIKPAETAEATSPPPAETVTPIEKPTPPARPKPKEVAKKQPPKPVKVKSGSQGENDRNSTRGSSEGAAAAESQRNSLSAVGRQGSGSAAVANYPGTVGGRIGRMVHRMAGGLATGKTVRVRLTIGVSGQLASLSIVRSSGLGDFDDAVMEAVRRAAPFPPLPSEWGKSSWTFNQDVQAP